MGVCIGGQGEGRVAARQSQCVWEAGQCKHGVVGGLYFVGFRCLRKHEGD